MLAVIGLLLVALVALIVGSYYWIRWRMRRFVVQQAAEAQDYPKWADRNGLTYEERDDTLVDELARHLPFSDFVGMRGRRSQGLHVFSGEVNGRRTAFFQLTSFRAGGRGGPVGMCTVAVAQLTEPSADMSISRHTRIDRVTGPGGQRPFLKNGTPSDLPDAQLDWLESSLNERLSPRFHLKDAWITCYLGGPLTMERGLVVFNALHGFLNAPDTSWVMGRSTDSVLVGQSSLVDRIEAEGWTDPWVRCGAMRRPWRLSLTCCSSVRRSKGNQDAMGEFMCDVLTLWVSASSIIDARKYLAMICRVGAARAEKSPT